MKKPPQCLLGALSPSKRDTAKHHVQPPLGITPTRHCNSMQPNAAPGEITRYMTCPLRPGSERQHPSKGGC